MLNPMEEAQFQRWAAVNNVPITADYDMRGFWKNGASGAQINPYDQQLHFPDTYKTPLHESFSSESMFANPTANPPQWNGRQLIDSQGNILFKE